MFRSLALLSARNGYHVRRIRAERAKAANILEHKQANRPKRPMVKPEKDVFSEKFDLAKYSPSPVSPPRKPKVVKKQVKKVAPKVTAAPKGKPTKAKKLTKEEREKIENEKLIAQLKGDEVVKKRDKTKEKGSEEGSAKAERMDADKLTEKPKDKAPEKADASKDKPTAPPKPEKPQKADAKPTSEANEKPPKPKKQEQPKSDHKLEKKPAANVQTPKAAKVGTTATPNKK